MSTVKAINFQHPNAASPSITIAADGSVAIPSMGGRVEGSSYILVAGDGTASENGTALDAAYTAATALTPNGSALADTNRAWVVVAPGSYDTTLTMDTQYVNVVSLDGEMSVSLTGIDVSADNVLVRGIDVGTANFLIATNLAGLVAEKCAGGNDSFGRSKIASGTFVDCVGGEFAFGGTASGTFINCTSGEYAFGAFGPASGTFTNCTGGFASFGGQGTASGTFTSCKGGEMSFGGLGTASGSFKNCEGGPSSFAGGLFGITGTASGTFVDCTGLSFSFGGGAGAGGIASGTFVRCTGDGGSFAAGDVVEDPSLDGTLSGNLLYCRVTEGGFPTVAGGGIIRLSLNGDFSEENQG